MRPSPTSPKLAADTTVFNQEACLASRYAFVEGDQAQVEALCARLVERLGVDRDFASAVAQLLPSTLREEVEVMSAMGDIKVWGHFDGRGLVILSDPPGRVPPRQQDVERGHGAIT